MNKGKQSRRDFISTVALGTLGATSLLTSCAGTDAIKQLKEGTSLSLLDEAPDGPKLRAGLVGCGGRGTVQPQTSWMRARNL